MIREIVQTNHITSKRVGNLQVDLNKTQAKHVKLKENTLVAGDPKNDQGYERATYNHINGKFQHGIAIVIVLAHSVSDTLTIFNHRRPVTNITTGESVEPKNKLPKAMRKSHIHK